MNKEDFDKYINDRYQSQINWYDKKINGQSENVSAITVQSYRSVFPDNHTYHY